jgi:hypothetical protein
MEREPLTLESESMVSVPSSKPLKIKPSHLRLIDAGEKITEEEPDSQDKAFTTRYFVQATLPYRNPKDNPPHWTRYNGNYSLSIEPGYVRVPGTQDRRLLGYPYGSVPRLLMFWLTTEALRTGNRKLVLGSSLTDFMTQLGLNPRNGGPGTKRSDRRRLHDQMERLFGAKISFEYVDDRQRSWMNMDIAPEGQLWWDPKSPEQLTLYESWIELGEKFFKAITSAPIPVDLRALRELKNSPLALDLYAWCTYKTYLVNKNRKPQRVGWSQLQEQFGTENEHVKSFKQTAKYALRKISVVYPGLNFDETDGGLIIQPGATAIPSK